MQNEEDRNMLLSTSGKLVPSTDRSNYSRLSCVVPNIQTYYLSQDDYVSFDFSPVEIIDILLASAIITNCSDPLPPLFTTVVSANDYGQRTSFDS